MVKTKRDQPVAENRYAYHQYHISERWEAGIVLLGTEVKSIREGRVNLRDSFVRMSRGEIYVINLHITPYSRTSTRDLDSSRERKLLLKKQEIQEIEGGLTRKGLTCVPIKLYFKRGMAKLQIALCKGKEQKDKRQDLKKREHQREMDRALKKNR